jgi:predicted CopG family antitoxin
MATLDYKNLKMIRVEDDVHDELSKLGSVGQTYNDVIKMLVEHWKKTKK